MPNSTVDAAKLHKFDELFALAKRALMVAREADYGIRDDQLDSMAGSLQAIDLFIHAAELAQGPPPVENGHGLRLIPGGQA